MNPSGSEFTLRVAICDLVERLKRMQHKCTYLEECRNQLVKEVIRLRLQNEWLARQINDSPEISSLPQNIQCFCNQQNLVNNATDAMIGHAAHCHLMNGQEMNNSSNDSNGSNRSTDTRHSNNKDESIHLINILNELDREDLGNRQDSIRQLTIQMLKDLDNEMKTGQLKSDLINFVKNNLQTTTNDDDEENELIKFDNNDPEMEAMGTIQNNAIDNDCQQTTTNISNDGDYEAFNNNSDYYSNSHNLNVPLDDLRYSQSAAIIISGSNNSKQTTTVDPLFINNDGTNSAKCQTNNINSILSCNNKLPNIIHQQSSKNVDRKDFDYSSNKQQITFTIDAQQESQLMSIINTVKNDLKYLHQGVLASTDRLNKIKTRQLRHFFQKQINLDQHTTTTANK